MAVNINTLITGTMTLGSGGSTPEPTPEPYNSPLTRFTYANGTIEEYDIQGDWTDSVNAELGLQDGETWLWKGEIVRVDVGTNVTNMGDYCLYDTMDREAPYVGLANLTTVTIPNTVTDIGTSTFYGCSGLTSVTIPDGVTSIGNYAFDYCIGLTSVTIPAGVSSIGERAFSDCSGLTSVTIPDGVTNIGASAFSGCSGLTSVTITANGGNALDVKQMVINAIDDTSISDNITWNMPN